VEISPSHHLEIGDIVGEISYDKDARAIANAGGIGEPELNLIQSPFGNEEDPN
jgi:hypothetical protein